jgi:hypothetical protein
VLTKACGKRAGLCVIEVCSSLFIFITVDGTKVLFARLPQANRWAQLQTRPYENKESAYNNLHHCKLLQFIWTGDRSKPLSNQDLTGD